MDDPELQSVVGIAGGVILGAVFTAVSAGLETLGEVRLHAIAEANGPLSPVAKRVRRQWPRVRARLMVARVACLTVAAALAATFRPSSATVSGPVAVVLVAVTYAAFAQVATAAARQRPDGTVLRVYRVLSPLEILMTPIVWPLMALDTVVSRLFPPTSRSPEEERLAELAVEHVLERGEETGSIAEEHAQLLWNVLEFKNTVAREIMVPRTQVVAFEAETDIAEVLESIIEHGHSRYPVYRKTIDQVDGLLYAKDLFQAFREEGGIEAVELSSIIRRPAYFVPENQKIGAVLREMQSRRIHMAVVADEFGGVNGIVTLEDIVEEIVGEIQDEHDEEEELYRVLGEDRYEVQAGISVYDLSELLGEPLREQGGDYDSLGGLIVHLAGKVPEEGECVRVGSWDLCVLEGDDRRVARVMVVRAERSSEPDGKEGSEERVAS